MGFVPLVIKVFFFVLVGGIRLGIKELGDKCATVLEDTSKGNLC